MANKRQKKKQEKKRLQSELKSRNIKTHKQSIKYLRQLYYEEQEKEIKTIRKEQQKERKKRRKGQLRAEKLQYIENNGFSPFDIPSKDLDKSWDYIKEKYKKLSFDYNKIYTFKDGYRMYIAYRDYSAENDLNDILKMLDRFSGEELLERLTELVNTPPIHTGKGTGSSGKAGDFKSELAPQFLIEHTNREIYNENRRKPKKKYAHTGEHKGYQILKSNGRVSFNEYTPRKMLQVMVAIMDNVTEGDRTAFYSDKYKQLQYHNPEFAKILPPPKY